MFAFRKAEERDGARLAALAERTFRDTYGAVNTVENMSRYCAANYGAAIQAREILDPAVAILLGEHETELIGFVHLRRGPGPASLGAARPIEIQRFYVTREWHGRGVAAQQMTAALAYAQGAGADQVWLAVWEHNLRARAFYRKAGFTEVGEQDFLLGADRHRDIVRARPAALTDARGGKSAG